MSQESESDQVVAALYRFVALDDFADLKPVSYTHLTLPTNREV